MTLLLTTEQMNTLKIERTTNGGGTVLQQELSDVSAQLTRCVTQLHELSERKAKLELRLLVSGS